MKRALVAAVLLAGAAAAFFLWPDGSTEPLPHGTEGTYSPAPLRTTGSAIVRPGPAQEVSGRVVDARGRGIAGAQVFVAHQGTSSMASESCDCPLCRTSLLECACPGGAAQVGRLVEHREGELQPDQTASADEAGFFHIPDPPSGPFLIWATAPGYGPAFRYGAQASTRIELALGSPQAVWGRVLDERRRPVPEALVTVISAMLPRFVESSPGADASFRIDGLGIGPHYLIATAPGYLPSGLALSVPTGSTALLTLAKARTLEVSVSERGRPVANAVLRLHADHFARTASSPEGTFRFEGLAPGSYTVAATLGHRFASAPVELRQPLTRVILELEEALEVRGHVVDDGGGPIAGALVVADLEAGSLTETHTEPDGAFAFDGLPANARLIATHEGYDPASARVDPRGGPVSMVLHAQATVEGIVVSSQDEPLPQVEVVARGAGFGAATSDATGAFKLALLKPGPVLLVAHHSTYGSGEMPIEAPARDVRLKLSTRGAVRARLVDSERIPLAGAHAAAWREGEAESFRNTFSGNVPSGQDGMVLLAGLPPGPHRLRFTAQGLRPAERRSVPVPESGELDLGDVVLEAGKAISGVVLQGDDTPGPGAVVHAQPHSPGLSESATADRDGSFTIAGLEAGGYYLSATLENAFAEAIIAQAGDRGVVIRLSSEVRLRGRVLAADGHRPLSRFTVDGALIESEDGRFEVSTHPWRGQVSFQVGAPGFLPAFRQVAVSSSGVADGGDVVLESPLSIGGTVRDGQGAPVAGAAVTVGEREGSSSPQDEPARTVSAADGRFRLDGFAPGVVTLLARRGDLVAEMDVVLNTSIEDAVLTLRGKGAIEGVVRGSDGKPVVAVLRARTSSTTSDALGRYRLDGLAPERHTLSAALESDSLVSTTREVEVRAGESVRLDLELGASGGALRVAVP